MSKRMIRDVIAGRPLVTGTPDISVRAACRLMAENRIGAVLVVDGQRHIVGIFTERDAMNKILAPGRDPDKTRLSEVMVSDVQTISANRSLAYALYLMAGGGFRHVPVLEEDGSPIGMVSARDALGEDIVEVERELKRLEEIEGSIGY
ncbi:MAG TPA: CBS domain-containing protein [Rhodocyclaceae bacterium]|nr:CBS domain-containing protein [Rhodocyclaceae bacterium]